MHRKKTSEANAIPLKDRFPRRDRRYQVHKPAAGRNDRRDGLLRAAIPQSSPNSTHGSQPLRSSRSRASQTSVVSRNVDRLVSHTQRVDQNITFGSRAHAQAEPTAIFSEKILRAIRKIGRHVSAEKKLFSVRRKKADARE